VGVWAVMEALRQLWSYPLFRVGEGALTVGAVATVLLSFVALYLVSLWVKRLITRRLLTRTSLDLGAREAIGSLFRYFVLFLGSIVIIQSAGIDLTALNVLAGAIGIGFGLQNIANNFISGIIILLERPIKVGDRVEVGDIDGRVVAIGARATTVITNDNIIVGACRCSRKQVSKQLAQPSSVYEVVARMLLQHFFYIVPLLLHLTRKRRPDKFVEVSTV
jgi:small-conductance mechanosensitive channel